MEATATTYRATDFESIIDTHKSSVYRICRIYAKDPMEPEDLFQEVVLQAWKSFSSFSGKSQIGTWLYRVALNVCLSTKHKLDKKDQQTVRLDAISFEPGDWDGEEDEKYQWLRLCMASLKAADRSLLVLYLEELSYAEIGKVLGLTENHVAVKMKRIRSKLFDCITQRMEK